MEAVSSLDRLWEANPADLEIADVLQTYNYKLQALAQQKEKWAKALEYTERNIEIARTVLEQDTSSNEKYQLFYLDAVADSILISLRQDPTNAERLLEQAEVALDLFLVVKPSHHLHLVKAHSIFILEGAEGAKNTYYQYIISQPASDVANLITTIEAQVAELVPEERWIQLEEILLVVERYAKADNRYEESRRYLIDPVTSSDSWVYDGTYWQALRHLKTKFEAALDLRKMQLMPADQYEKEQRELSRIFAICGEILLRTGQWRDIPRELDLAYLHLEQYNWPKSFQGISALMEGRWSDCEAQLREIKDLRNDGFRPSDYPQLSDYLLNLPENITSSPNYQEHQADWNRILNR